MSNTTVPNLPAVTSLSGSAQIPVVQNGTSYRATAAQIAGLASGIVTSVGVSGGVTGLTTSGGPITTAGTITLQGTVNIASGGTGQNNATSAFNVLSPITSTGDLIIGNGVNSSTRLPVGQNGYVLLSNGTTASWQPVASAGGGTVTSVSGSGGTTGLTLTGGPITAIGTLTLGGTLAVANGGTGVTVSSGASSVVLRDANQNVTANYFYAGFSNTAASTLITLTAASVFNYVITGSGGQTIKLPDATTLPSGVVYTFNNNQSSGTIVVQNNSATTVVTVQSGGFVNLTLLSNSIAAGSWDTHYGTPSNASWSTNTLSWAGSITNATWNGAIVTGAYGGTGVNNSTNTITVGGNVNTASSFTTTGAFALGLVTTAATTATLPAGTSSNYLISSATQLATNPVSGTPSSSNFLRGDGTWSAVASSMVYPSAGIAVSTGSTWGASLSVPVTAANGGTGLTAVGTSGNVLTSNGTAWVSSTPAAIPAGATIYTANNFGGF